MFQHMIATHEIETAVGEGQSLIVNALLEKFRFGLHLIQQLILSSNEIDDCNALDL